MSRLRSATIALTVWLVSAACASGPDRVDKIQKSADPDWPHVMVVAYPRSPTEIEVVFTEEVDDASALAIDSYRTESGAKLHGVERDPGRPRTYVLRTDFMDADALKVDHLRAEGVKTAAGKPLDPPDSPPFVLGILDVKGIAASIGSKPPFASSVGGSLVSMSCVPCCPPKMVEDVGFTFLQQTSGGPYSGIKVVVDTLAPEIVAAAAQLPRGEGPHVLFRGGFLRDDGGELRLVDAGFTRSSLYDEKPLPTPPSYPITNAQITGDATDSSFAHSLSGAAVELGEIKILAVSAAAQGRIVSYVDQSGVAAEAWALPSVTGPLLEGKTFQRMTGLLHRVNGANQIVLVFDDDLQ